MASQDSVDDLSVAQFHLWYQQRYGVLLPPGAKPPQPPPPAFHINPNSAPSSSSGQQETDPDAITPLPPLPITEPDTETTQREDEERAAYLQQDFGAPSFPESQFSGVDEPIATPPPARTNEAIQPKSTKSRNPQQYQSGGQMTLPIRGKPSERMEVQDRESTEEDKPCCC